MYENGSGDPARRSYRYFFLRVYTTDSAGHCAVQIKMNSNLAEPNDGACQFSIQAEAAAINRLGCLFEQFSHLHHLELRWSLDDGEMLENTMAVDHN